MSEDTKAEFPKKLIELDCLLKELRDTRKMQMYVEVELLGKSVDGLKRNIEAVDRLMKERFGDGYEKMKDHVYLIRGGRVEYRPENGPVEVLREGR